MITFPFRETVTESLGVIKRPSFPHWESLFVRTGALSQSSGEFSSKVHTKELCAARNPIPAILFDFPLSVSICSVSLCHTVVLKLAISHKTFFKIALDSGVGAAGSPSCPWHIEHKNFWDYLFPLYFISVHFRGKKFCFLNPNLGGGRKLLMSIIKPWHVWRSIFSSLGFNYWLWGPESRGLSNHHVNLWARHQTEVNMVVIFPFQPPSAWSI